MPENNKPREFCKPAVYIVLPSLCKLSPWLDEYIYVCMCAHILENRREKMTKEAKNDKKPKRLKKKKEKVLKMSSFRNGKLNEKNLLL